MTPTQLSALLTDLLALARESEWLEFKRDNSNPEEIGEYISALSNSAALYGRNKAYLIWGVEDNTLKIVGTQFKPRRARKGNEELENWLLHSLEPQIGFKMHEWNHDGHAMVLFEIPRATQTPVAFRGERYVRIGSYKKLLKSNPPREQELWATLSRKPFAQGIAKGDLTPDETLALLDFSACFDLLKLPLPSDREGILRRLADEKLIVPKPGGQWDITNLGAILLAKNLNQFDRIGRKALRVIKYTGSGRTELCEEAGTGIDKVIGAVEAFQLPPPNFEAMMAMPPGFTRVTLFAHKMLSDMGSKERIRACYQHACLCFVSRHRMTNASLRKRFGIDEKNSSKASRLIGEAVKAGVIRLRDPDARDRDRSYLPFWA